ncbi:hypothetical protein EJM73_08845 [Clostridium botulinum]|uniref:hypothetical protein n=1 Tax=Clostridium botulinum TaxID=1491 RepID=UPI0013756DEA|nr:hypothetical protein [Clostridium botulinum]NCI19731.1 hypothetical protein [Clostridium botulinum]NCI35769.1 hypothetical protein [Clostridium botulinum]NCI71626.1 hypothetical protein [Clostridium botulinum]NDI38818.1 hypothetical protein [Clostridium botulinum]HCL4455172.1 hypothetical protein [Clostridium botulinum]
MIYFDKFKYTIKHRKAFRKVEKQLLGHNTIRGYLHDFDKLIMFVFLNQKTTHRIHRKISRHHSIRAKTRQDYIQMVIDWECARLTKPDKPLNAYDTLYKFYPKLENRILPILKEFKLI